MLQNDPELFELSMSEKTQPLMDLVKKHCEENIKPCLLYTSDAADE